MSLYRVKKVYYIDILTQSGRVRRSTGTTDKKAAEAYHQRVKEQIWRKEKMGESPPITWLEAVANWVGERKGSEPDKYRLRALDISPQETLPLSKDLMERCLSSQIAPASFNRTLALLVAIHNAAGVTPPSVKRKPSPQGRTRWLKQDEWQKLARSLQKHSPLLLDCAEFTLATGLRENNVLNLEWSEVDLRRRQVVVYADEFKTSIALGVPLTDAAMAVLTRRKGLNKQYVFAGEYTGLPLYKASNRAWYDALRETGLKETGVVWHTLRHTWASWHVMGGTRLEELMKLGGWKTYSMVQRYAHLSVDHLAKIAENAKPVA